MKRNMAIACAALLSALGVAHAAPPIDGTPDGGVALYVAKGFGHAARKDQPALAFGLRWQHDAPGQIRSGAKLLEYRYSRVDRALVPGGGALGFGSGGSLGKGWWIGIGAGAAALLIIANNDDDNDDYTPVYNEPPPPPRL